MHVIPSSLTLNQLTNDNFQFGQQQQQHGTIQQHNPSVQSVLQSVDVRNELQSSRNPSVGVPLPSFIANDQLSSTSNNLNSLQSQFGTIEIPQKSVDQTPFPEIDLRGGATIQRGRLLGSTIGQMVNPGSASFQVADHSFEDSNINVLDGNSIGSAEFDSKLRLNNLGSAAFIGSSPGFQGQQQFVSLSNPQVIGVSRPQQIDVSLPRTVNQANQFTILPDDDSFENFQSEFVRTSRSQNTGSSKTSTINNQNTVKEEDESVKSLEKMLENSFGPDILNNKPNPPTKGLVKTPDMSSLPLEKHSDSSSSLFPPFSETSTKKPSPIRQAILK